MPVSDFPAFAFVSAALPEDAIEVVSFRGEEALSECYRFECLLACRHVPDAKALLQSGARLSVDTGGGIRRWEGRLESFAVLHEKAGRIFCRAVLRPKAWGLALDRRNRVFVHQKPSAFLAEALTEGGLQNGTDFSLQLQETWPEYPMVCQYNESDLAFFSRWMEHLGACYRFEEHEQGERLAASDSPSSLTAAPGLSPCRYAPPTGREGTPDPSRPLIFSFSRRRRVLPTDVTLKDVTPDRPDLDLTCRARVKGGLCPSEVFLYGEHVTDPETGAKLAAVRAEELGCAGVVCSGDSNTPLLRPGCTFNLEGHYRQAWNRGYLITSVHHEGSRKGIFTPDGRVPETLYRNSFTCIPDDVPYRPARRTPRPRMGGVAPARIDAAGSGKTAELDAQGRYTVVLPMDTEARSGGKNSCRIRMLQPYAGDNAGFHAPLHKNTEVLLAFCNGDPDRPLITSAAPNPQTQSVVTDANPESDAIVSASGWTHQNNGKNQVWTSPDGLVNITFGIPTDMDFAGNTLNSGDTTLVNVTPGIYIKCRFKNEVVLGENATITAGVKVLMNLLSLADFFVGGKLLGTIGSHSDVALVKSQTALQKLKAAVQETEASLGRMNTLARRVEANGITEKAQGLAVRFKTISDSIKATSAAVATAQEQITAQTEAMTGMATSLEEAATHVADALNRTSSAFNEITEEKLQEAMEISETAAAMIALFSTEVDAPGMDTHIAGVHMEG